MASAGDLRILERLVDSGSYYLEGEHHLYRDGAATTLCGLPVVAYSQAPTRPGYWQDLGRLADWRVSTMGNSCKACREAR